MSAFDKIIGYETIKNELIQLCDMIHNKEVYTQLGARLPRGILLYGDPGLGKTLMAKCFIEESGLQSYTVRRNMGTDNFVTSITDTFQKAKENAPCIVFLDDMDKFANEDEKHCDAEEYVAVQAGIDEVKDADVFVFATVNEIRKLPRSLRRSGRFDRRIKLNCPTEKDAEQIIAHYLNDKKVSSDVNLEDVAMMISYSSCAELETILNDAAITAAYARHDSVNMSDLTQAVLRTHYNAPDSYAKTSEEDRRKIALHEAGHLVVSEALCAGSVGLASIRESGRSTTGGFIRRCKPLKRRPHHILISLAGKAAVELYYSDTCASGCHSDIESAFEEIRIAISESGTNGLGMIDVADHRFPVSSENFTVRNEAVVHAELERYMYKTRDILLRNRVFLEKAAAALIEKDTLLYSDIRTLRESINLVSFEI